MFRDYFARSRIRGRDLTCVTSNLDVIELFFDLKRRDIQANLFQLVRIRDLNIVQRRERERARLKYIFDITRLSMTGVGREDKGSDQPYPTLVLCMWLCKAIDCTISFALDTYSYIYIYVCV